MLVQKEIRKNDSGCHMLQEENSGSGSNRMLPPPCIHRYAAVGRCWKEQGVLSKDSSKLVSCIKVKTLIFECLAINLFMVNISSLSACAPRVVHCKRRMSADRFMVSSFFFQF